MPNLLQVLSVARRDTLAFTEGGVLQLLTVTLTVSDSDSTDQYNAWVEIISGYVEQKMCWQLLRKTEFLVHGIAVEAFCLLNGQSANATYKTALQSITYDNTNDDDPDTSNRTITWIVMVPFGRKPFSKHPRSLLRV